MIYLIVSRGKNSSGSIECEAGTPLHVNISGRDVESQPIIGFTTIALAEKYLDRKNIPKDEYKFILKDRRVSNEYHQHPILLVENESQMDEMEKDEEAYDYEGHIFKNAS
jgi:hypothetical protein